MRNLKTVLVLIFIVNSFFCYSQENNINTSIIEPFQKDALFREKVFVHLNKTCYFSKDHIWFTAYVSNDFDNSPSEYTTNLKVNLLNDKGAIVKSKNIFIQKGVGIGDFLIDDTFSGKYYIQAYTNFMKNFGDENSFFQEIEIVNLVNEKENKQEDYANNYDIQIFPESGFLLEDTENTIGLKALINGKGYPFSGKIIDSKGTKITAFEGNQSGMSTCKFMYSKNETYKAIVTIKGSVQNISLPKANKTGINLSVSHLNSDNIILTLKTNSQTIPNLKNETLTLLFYRNNFISKAATLLINNNEELTQKLIFDKNEMLHGVNIVTLFKGNKPVAERKFFIDKQSEQSALLIEELKTENDSTNFKIKTINSNFEPISAQLSISILPKDAETFKENQTIKSAFLLTPYVKGAIENPSYYFKNSSPQELEYLDILLLCQGWNTYTLGEKIKAINPKEKYAFESGFTLNGKVKKAPKGYDIGVLSKKNRLSAISNINENSGFSFKNVYAYKNDSVKIAFIKQNESLVKPKGVSFNETEKDHSTNLPALNNKKPFIEEKVTSDKEQISVNYTNYPNVELLDEVVLKNVKTKEKETIYDVERDLALKHNVIASGFYKNKKVTKQMEIEYQTVFDYFMSLGFIKRINLDTYQIVLRNTPQTLTSTGSGIFPPRIFLNDNPLIRDITLIIERLQGMSMVEVDEILINRSGGGGGMDGTGGIIKIYLKKGDHQYFGEDSKNLYENLIVNTGFDRAADYYKPQYNIYSKEAFNWTEIDWMNSIKTNEKGEAIIKIPNNEFSNEYQFIINGFSNDGLLFYDNYKSGSSEF